MRVLITGVAGFIGSNLAGKFLSSGHSVIGIDKFSDYYSRAQKEFNLSKLISHREFNLIETDLMWAGLEEALKNSDIIFHLAAQPGVLHSWGENFNIYVRNNILATQYLLEILKYHPEKPLIFASSSSVYGNTDHIPMNEKNILNPISPYGLTKLTCEKLLELYHGAWGIKYLCLRFFTVFGPGQRPDMAIHKFLKAALHKEKISIYGDGEQRRDFTYIETLTDFLLGIIDNKKWGITLNVGGGKYITVNEAVSMISSIVGKKMDVQYIEKQKGDMKETLADIDRATELFDYAPSFNIEDGIVSQWEWIKSFYA